MRINFLQAFEYIKDNHGIDTEASYPYKGEDMKCHFNKKTIGATDMGYVDIEEGSEEKLKVAVATQGPISVAIDAGHKSFQLYKKGFHFCLIRSLKPQQMHFLILGPLVLTRSASFSTNSISFHFIN